jgi:hypothetical protein
MKLLHRIGLLVGSALLPLFSIAQVAVVRVSASEFAPSRNESVSYTVRADRAGTLGVEVLSADGDVVQRLPALAVQPGEHSFSWNGRDARNSPVPDEAYCVRATFEAGGTTAVDDPCSRTGGEVISGIRPSLAAGGDIGYSLEHPGRVLIRVGVKNGAMLRSLSVWRPRPAGRNLQRWNGFDESGLVDLRNERMALLVTAFRLPDFTVITTGNDSTGYRAWRTTANGWPERPDTPQGGTAQPLERNGQRIARQHYMARFKDQEPRITVTLATSDGKPLDATAPLPENVRVSVDLHTDDRWLMQEQLYEVAFFVNGDFVSEEENGYVPIAWIWNTAGLRPGRHLLTVNMTGFTGRVGTRTLAVQVR